MDKLILIDGNSLLNRAFYAMSVFSTKDGLPTNGIFGFVKLLFKILDDEKPRYMAVAFDVHAPTFRHKMYGAYKAERRPMPEELVRQVPVLKELLAAMKICTVELEGYEADDILGTLTRRFDGVHALVYTGDRDAYQLVKENVDVCFTKRGVSDLDRLTQENFYEKVGLNPPQIIDLKSLMGDHSDNIPGVHGIGEKGAIDLLHRFGSLDGVYSHLEEIKGALKTKLEEGRESAYFSYRLATIDTNVPLALTLADCEVTLPFPDEARTFFGKLEFRSLVDSAYFTAARPAEGVINVYDLSALFDAAKGEHAFSVCLEEEGLYLAFGGKQYFVRLRKNFLEPGYFLEETKQLLAQVFATGNEVTVVDYKAFLHLLCDLGISFDATPKDVTLLRYLCDSNLRPSSAKELTKDYALPEDQCALALGQAAQDAERKMSGSNEEALYRDLELPLARVLFDMERTGVRVDINKFPEFSEKFRVELEELSARIYALAGMESFNLNSPFQLSEVLFGKLGFETKGIKHNSRGGYSTNADVLEKLAEDHEIARLILRYREIQKLRSTYIDGIRPLVVGGIVHTTYNQTMTTTGRLSSANPNLQNIPVRTESGRELRRLFIAREGNILVDADYSQIELRLLAHFSGCKSLIEAYRSGADIHAATAARVFGVPLEEVTTPLRRRAKTINFGIIYGISAFGLAKDLGCTSSEANSYIKKYFEEHPEVKAYMDENVRRAREDGYVTTVLGRKRYIPEIKSSNYNLRGFGERAAMNMPLQGSAADIIKLAMLRVADRLKRDGFKSKLVLQVHDELVLDSPEEEAERAAAMLKEEMEGAISLDVPLIAEVAMGKSWYDAK